ncbi:MAG TPA: hypothetical protein VIK90_03660 [Limnochordales bacterium]
MERVEAAAGGAAAATTAAAVRLGVNYWPGYAGPGMWRDFREDEIERDLAALRAAGVEYTRSFVFWPDFMPEPDRVEPQALERLRRFLALHERAGLRVHLTFLVGHMSGENWPPRWMDDPGRLYTDPVLLLAQERLLEAVIGVARTSPAVEAYVLTNELPLFTGPAPAEAVRAWASRMYGLVKALDGGRPVSIGDGAWYVMAGVSGAFRPTLPQDVIAPHLYLAETHPERQMAAYGLALAVARRLAAAHGKEVWLEEFGATHSVFGEEEVARWAARVVEEARLHGATRIGWWCGLDFRAELAAVAPYRHHPHEISFGMLRADRSPRPVAQALREAVRAPLPATQRVGLLVPSYLYRAYPFSERPAGVLQRALLNAYAALRALGYLPEAVLEEDLLEAGDGADFSEVGRVAGALPPVLVAPSVQKLLAPTWERLARYSGRVVYSYLHATGVRSHEGGWASAEAARRFFGGEPHNRFNLAEPAPRALTWEGGRLELPAGPDPFTQTPLVLEPKEAQVVGRDEQGRPLWVRVGRRDMLLYPLEALAEEPEAVATFYRAVLGR